MRKPDESLDDYIVGPETSSQPPRPVSLRRTGEVQVLKPLTPANVRAKRTRIALRPFRPLQPLWFNRFLAVGSGALVFIALVLVSAILMSIRDQPTGPAVATSDAPDDTLTQPGELFSFDLSVPLTLVPTIEPVSRRRPARRLAIYKPTRKLRAPLQPEEPNFIPTTLVIYAKNGVISSRIEPWLQAGNKRPPTSND